MSITRKKLHAGGLVFSRLLTEVSGGRLDPIANQDRRKELERALRSSPFPVTPLRKLVSFNKVLVNEIADGECYIGLENVDRDSGEYVGTIDRESISSAIQFSPGQILFPKLRPYLNKTHFATFGGLCSTEFHVLTPDGVSGEYLTALLRSNSIVGITSLLMTGNTLPRLQVSDIEQLPVPVPPKPIQEKVVVMWHGALKQRAVCLAQAQQLLQSIDDVLLDELGIPRKPESPNTLESRIFKSKFSAVTGHRWDPGRYNDRHVEKRNLVKRNVDTFRKLRECVTNVRAGDWGNDDEIVFDDNALQRCLVIRNTEFDNSFNLRIESGRAKYRLVERTKLKMLDIRSMDLLVEKSGGSIDQPVGRVALLSSEHLKLGPIGYSNFIVKMRAMPRIVHPVFLYYWLRTAHRIGITESMQSQTSGLRNLILDEYFDQEIPVPDVTEQERIAKKLERISDQAKALRELARNDLEIAKRNIEALILGKETAE